MHFWIDIKFIKYLGQFKQNDICTFVHDMKFQKKNYLNTLLNKLQDHVFIYSILNKFWKRIHMLEFEFFKQFNAKHNKVKLLFFWW
jgi:hypothetical protein